MTTIDFISLSGPFVLWFNGEGRHCLLLETADQVIEYLMREDGGGWALDGTRDGLIECLNNADHWHFNDDRKPFQWVFECGEICTVNLIVGVQMPPKSIGPLNADLNFILGIPCFLCYSMAEHLRQHGWKIKTRAEAEQAAVIFWMLQLYLEHGNKWRDVGVKFLESVKGSGTGDNGTGLSNLRSTDRIHRPGVDVAGGGVDASGGPAGPAAGSAGGGL